MKKLIIILFILMLSLTIFCACGNQHNEQGGEVQMKPFASPDPNNPYDDKLSVTYTVDDITDWRYIFVELTNSESINNLFYDYKITDFGIEYTQYGEHQYIYKEGLSEPIVIIAPHRRIYDKSSNEIAEIRKQYANGENLFSYTRQLEIQFPVNDNLTNEDTFEYVKYLNSLPFVRVAKPYTSALVWFSSAGINNEPDIWWPAKISLSNAWSFSTGSSAVTVGLIDSGVRTTHDDLENQYVSNLGWGTNKGEDDLGHGTKVAGLMFASGIYYLQGVCYNAQFASFRANIGDGNEIFSYVVDSIEAAQNQGISILCFTGGFKESDLGNDDDLQDLEDAIANFDGLLIVSAGNYGENLDVDGNELYPQCFDLDNIIVVGASTKTDGKLSSSNYGEHTVDLFAPGDDMFSTNNDGDLSYIANLSGTSFSAPLVAGVAALVASYYANNNLTIDELRARVLYATDNISGFDDFCATGGRLNAVKAFHPHAYYYESMGIMVGHRLVCTACGYYASSVQPHIWMPEYIMGTPHGYSCRKCHVWTQYIDLPHPDFAPGIRERLGGIEIGENGIGVLPISEHVAIIYDNGRYGLIIECDENGKPLSKIPKEIFAEGFDVDALQKELDKKTEWVISPQNEKNKKLKESSQDE